MKNILPEVILKVIFDHYSSERMFHQKEKTQTENRYFSGRNSSKATYIVDHIFLYFKQTFSQLRVQQNKLN